MHVHCTIWYKWSMWNQVESPIIDSKWILLFNVMQALFIKCIWQHNFNGIKYIFFDFSGASKLKWWCGIDVYSRIDRIYQVILHYFFLNFYFHIWMSNSISLQAWFLLLHFIPFANIFNADKICQVKGIWRMQVVHFWDIALL